MAHMQMFAARKYLWRLPRRSGELVRSSWLCLMRYLMTWDRSRNAEVNGGSYKMADDTAVGSSVSKARSNPEFIIAGHSHIFALGAARDYAGPESLTPVEAVAEQGYFLMETWGQG